MRMWAEDHGDVADIAGVKIYRSYFAQDISYQTKNVPVIQKFKNADKLSSYGCLTINIRPNPCTSM